MLITFYTILAAFFDQIFPWSFWLIDQLDRVFHICLEFCHVVSVVLRLAVCCVVTLRCVALCSDLLFVVSPSCVALRCVVLQSAVCCVHWSCCVALCCCHALYLFCFDVVFSSLSLCCVFPVVLHFLSCLLSFVELSRIASPCFVLFLPCVWDGIACIVLPFYRLCCLVLFPLCCIALRCVVFCWYFLSSLCCVALHFVLSCCVLLRCVRLLRCVALRCCVVDKSCLITLVMF